MSRIQFDTHIMMNENIIVSSFSLHHIVQASFKYKSKKYNTVFIRRT